MADLPPVDREPPEPDSAGPKPSDDQPQIPPPDGGEPDAYGI